MRFQPSYIGVRNDKECEAGLPEVAYPSLPGESYNLVEWEHSDILEESSLSLIPAIPKFIISIKSKLRYSHKLVLFFFQSTITNIAGPFD